MNLTPIIKDPLFPTITARLKESNETFLDVGCCVGQVSRYLIAEGISSERLYGTDLQSQFLDIGYELFHDKSKNKGTYIAGDMLQEDDPRLGILHGRIDIIYASAFFHLFERDGQLKIAKQMVNFLKSDNPKTMIFGRQGGPKVPGWEKYLLDSESWQRLWDEVGEATGTRWRAEMDLEDDKTYSDWIKASFAVYRVI